MKFLILSIFFILTQLSIAETFFLSHSLGQIHTSKGYHQFNLGRGETIETGQTLKLGINSTLLIESSLKSQISILGPASLEFSGNEIILHYGNFFIDASKDSKISLVWNQWVIPIQKNEVFIEIDHQNINDIVWHQVNQSSRLGHNILKPGFVYIKSREQEILSRFSRETLDTLKEKHKPNLDAQIHNRHFSDKVEFNRIEVMGGLHAGWSTYKPSSESYIQKDGFIGIQIKNTWSIFWNIDDEQSTRDQYVNALQSRIGLRADASVATIRQQASVNDRSVHLSTKALLGIGFLGAFIDGELGLQNIQLSTGLKASTLPVWGLSVGYKIDLKKITDQEVFLALAFNYSRNVLVENGEFNVLNSDELVWNKYQFESSFGFRF